MEREEFDNIVRIFSENGYIDPVSELRETQDTLWQIYIEETVTFPSMDKKMAELQDVVERNIGKFYATKVR